MEQDFFGKIREEYFGLTKNIKSMQKEILVALAVLVAAFVFFKPIIIILALIILAILSRIYEWFFKGIGLGIELMTFATVVCSALYGPFIGALVGISSLTASVFVNQENPKFLPISWAGLIIIAYFSSWFVGKSGIESLTNTGIYSSIVYNIVVGPLFFLLLQSRIGKLLFFALTNIGFNYFVFTKFAPMALAILR